MQIQHENLDELLFSFWNKNKDHDNKNYHISMKDCHNPIFNESYSHHQLAEGYLHINFRLV